MKKIFSTVAASALAGQAMSQSAEPVSGNFIADPLLPIYLTAGSVLLLLILVAVVAIYVIRVLNYLTAETLRQEGQTLPSSKASHEAWWKRFVQKMNASVPVELEKEYHE